MKLESDGTLVQTGNEVRVSLPKTVAEELRLHLPKPRDLAMEAAEVIMEQYFELRTHVLNSAHKLARTEDIARFIRTVYESQ